MAAFNHTDHSPALKNQLVNPSSFHAFPPTFKLFPGLLVSVGIASALHSIGIIEAAATAALVEVTVARYRILKNIPNINNELKHELVVLPLVAGD